MISFMFRSTRLCVTACGIMHPRCCRPVTLKRKLPGYRPTTSWVHYTTSCNTQSSAPEDGQDYRPKHVELIGIINKPLLLHLVGCLHYLYQRFAVKQTLNLTPQTLCITDIQREQKICNIIMVKEVVLIATQNYCFYLNFGITASNYKKAETRHHVF